MYDLKKLDLGQQESNVALLLLFRNLPAVTNNDLGRVLVGHDNGWAWQSAPVSIGVVGLKGFAGHAGVQIVSHFEHIPVDRNNSHPVVNVTMKLNCEEAFIERK